MYNRLPVNARDEEYFPKFSRRRGLRGAVADIGAAIIIAERLFIEKFIVLLRIIFGRDNHLSHLVAINFERRDFTRDISSIKNFEIIVIIYFKSVVLRKRIYANVRRNVLFR